MTDGVLIADKDGRVQFANPAAGNLFENPTPTGRTVAEVLRHYQLVEAWRRCQQNREMQSESVETPSRRQFLQMVALPDQDTGGSSPAGPGPNPRAPAGDRAAGFHLEPFP